MTLIAVYYLGPYRGQLSKSSKGSYVSSVWRRKKRLASESSTDLRRAYYRTRSMLRCEYYHRELWGPRLKGWKIVPFPLTEDPTREELA
jgi:hypothetical protein